MPDSEKLQELNARSTTEVTSRVPLSLHPDQVSNQGATLVDAEGSGPTIDAYGAARHALRALHESARDIDTAHTRMLKPMPVVGAIQAKGAAPIIQMAIPPERAGELSSAMAASASRAAAVVERNASVIDKTIDKLNGFIAVKTSNPRPNEASVVSEAAAIRDYVKGLPHNERLNFLMEASDRKERDVVAAVLNSTPFVSGLNREQHVILRTEVEKSFAPTEVAQRAALVSIKQKIDTAMSSYARHYAERLPKVTTDPAAASLAALRGAAA